MAAWFACSVALVALSGCAGRSERKLRESVEASENGSNHGDGDGDGDGNDDGSDGGDDSDGNGHDGDGSDGNGSGNDGGSDDGGDPSDEPDDVSPPAPEPQDEPPSAPAEWDHSAEGTCARWNADTAERGEGSWDGDAASCNPGDISEFGRENALRHVNLYRWLAQLPPVETSEKRNDLAQACALLQDANWRRAGLSHTPPDSWSCYSQAAADGAITSNISTGPGVISVGAYFIEKGAEAAMGHRRIILSNQLGPIGLGSTGPGGASCMQALPGHNDAARAWVAWPPPGAFPLAAYGESPRSLSDTGWSIQSDYVDLSRAEVSIESGGVSLEVDVSELEASPGSESAIRIVPRGWRVQAGETYAVRVRKVRPKIEYEVTIVDCAG